MILSNLEELRNAPEFPRFRRFALAALAVWLAFFVVFGFALSARRTNEARLREAELVLKAYGLTAEVLAEKAEKAIMLKNKQ